MTAVKVEKESKPEIQIKKEVQIEKEGQIKKEKEDRRNVDVDVETVGEDVPLLMAGDLTSLLEQFEATERVNSEQPSIIPPASPPRPSTQTIRDALPPEVINRIKVKLIIQCV